MRQVSDIKPDTEVVVSNTVFGILNEGLAYFHQSQYFGKLRVYLFANFLGIGFLIILIILRLFWEMEFTGVVFLPLLALDVALLRFIWHGVEKKVPPEQRKLVFWAFLNTGLLIVFKLVMICSIILIPLVLKLAGDDDLLTYRYVDSGLYAGKYVLSRKKWNGQIVDNMGNVYEE